MSTQIQVDSTPRFLPLLQQPLPAKSAALRLARRVGWVGSLVLALMLIFAFFPGAVAPYDSTERVALPLQKPNAENILGTNDLGQDLLSELLYEFGDFYYLVDFSLKNNRLLVLEQRESGPE